jgi:hypothetical protein
MQQWNPNQNNQENDAQYTADSMRTNGASNPSVFDSSLANKLFYQCSTYLSALFSAFASKGYDSSDSDFATLTAQCANFLTKADLLGGLQVVAYAASVAFDASKNNGFKVVLGGSISFTVTGQTVGQRITLIFTMPAGGGAGWTITYPANVIGGVPVTDANANNVQEFIVDDNLVLRPLSGMTVS